LWKELLVCRALLIGSSPILFKLGTLENLSQTVLDDILAHPEKLPIIDAFLDLYDTPELKIVNPLREYHRSIKHIEFLMHERLQSFFKEIGRVGSAHKDYYSDSAFLKYDFCLKDIYDAFEEAIKAGLAKEAAVDHVIAKLTEILLRGGPMNPPLEATVDRAGMKRRVTLTSPAITPQAMFGSAASAAAGADGSAGAASSPVAAIASGVQADVADAGAGGEHTVEPRGGATGVELAPVSTDGLRRRVGGGAVACDDENAAENTGLVMR